MELTIAIQVDKGAVREANDDRALAGGKVYNSESGTHLLALPAIAVVCDGVGGYAGGGYAAETVLSHLAGYRPEELADRVRLQEALRQANLAVFARKREMPQYGRMATTIAGAVFGRENILLFHSGDTRIYRLSGPYFSRMTVDHSIVQTMLETGVIDEEALIGAPQRNQITRAMGLAECEAPELYEIPKRLAAGETYFICTDGLWDFVPEALMKRILSGTDSALAMAEQLVQCASDNGSTDNITACVCRASGVIQQTRLRTNIVLD